MQVANAPLVSLLKPLIQLCVDSEKGFRDAAERLHDPELQGRIAEFAQRRARFAMELRSLITVYGGKPVVGGTLSGTLERRWIDLQAALHMQDDAAILAACERCEDAVVEAYREALTQPNLPAHLWMILCEHFNVIKASHERVRKWRDMFKEQQHESL